MIFWFFSGKINFSCKNTIIIMNDFIVFVKFLDWIVVIWVRLARLIEENEDLKFWRETQLQKSNI